ncbi:hypothetical protein AGDE_01646 [Angomonas deanei]|uniref:DUF962 domain protein n=1 Tax=Angomonas deanei TaxID=59799 RepID=S9VHM1_9TRYP|nr:hypothetical protein AGDE_04430 [Angomonas deanei]EPY42277.1 hypothetical protein AGDE_01646 [Angomonas deanei]CAD2216567.1 Protein of unknown function (DUF962), putative [Angomonas deanei]|eukprot:EPY39498.1 hypothetical protein AGDE_04430 [Angomonas deanei]
MWTYLENYFNLKKSFVFYGAYHSEWRNQFVHVVFVPLIFSSALSFAARLEITPTLNASHIVAVFYAASFIVMEPIAGALYAPLIAGMQYLGQHFFYDHVPLAIGVHLFGWAVQIFGHAFLERRKPAFMEDPFQAIHSAVFFVWLEVLYMLGYRPSEKKKLDELIKQRIATMEAEGAAK